MPPRKRGRPARSTSTPDAASSNASPPATTTHQSITSSPRPTTGSRNPNANKKRKLNAHHDSFSSAENTLLDAWTPTQECALFKLLIHHKPTGVHKHMHMLSIFHALRSQGHVHVPPSPPLTPAPPVYNVPAPEEAPATSTRGAMSKNQAQQQVASHTRTETPEEEEEPDLDSTTASIKPSHLRIPALWQKLASLYDLESLDERENSWRFSNMQYDSEGGVLAADDEVEQTPTAKGPGRRRGKSGAVVPMLTEQELWPPGCKEFSLGGPIRHGGGGGDGGFAIPMDPEAQDLSHRMFARRLKSPDSSPSPSPPPPEPTTATKAESKGSKATPASVSVPSSSPPAASTRRKRTSTMTRRQSVSAGGASGRRGSKASVSAVTASSEVPDSEQGTEANEVKDEDTELAHSTRGASSRRSMRGVAAKEKQEVETKGKGKNARKK